MDKQRKKQSSKSKLHSNKNTVNESVVAAVTDKILSHQVRSQVRALVAEILSVVFITPVNPKEEWDQYVIIQNLLKKIQLLEAPLKENLRLNKCKRLMKINEFYKWSRDNGIKYDGVIIKEYPGYDLGLAATKSIKRNDLLFTIPHKLIMSEERIERGGKLFKLSNLRLAFLLMTEALNPESFWKPYIDLLPDCYNTVLYYGIEEMAQLRGSNCLSAALKQCRLIARCYATIYHWPNSDLPFDVFKEYFHYDLYRWAVSTVMTRENLIPRTKQDTEDELIAALIPFWDMANHRHGHITSYFNMETCQMESTAQDDFNEGEQIFIHYGDRSNAELLIHNGFINSVNPKDSIAIKLGLSQSDPLYEKRSQLLQLLNIPKNGELKVLPAPEHISPELLAFVRVFNMNEEQLQHWICSERATDLLHIDCALETSLESKTWQYLQTRLMLLLRVFPTTLEADETQLAGVKCGKLQMAQIPVMILEYRILEKRILAAALDYAKQRTKA
ncbi:actin-histidine N-methyltransferase [Glossina fuscipes]|uniref:protein-histidine N-methyltransferase n=2 Tax=Nemorhina TaxID=44051 RepID=A0A9C5YUM4_9MUSC|nr:actin-histidine N-methyltransferase [Glossina fuscipes]